MCLIVIFIISDLMFPHANLKINSTMYVYTQCFRHHKEVSVMKYNIAAWRFAKALQNRVSLASCLLTYVIVFACCANTISLVSACQMAAGWAHSGCGRFSLLGSSGLGADTSTSPASPVDLEVLITCCCCRASVHDASAEVNKKLNDVEFYFSS